MNNLIIEKQKIRKYFYAGSVMSIAVLVIILSLNYIRSLDIEYSKKIEQLSTAVMDEKKVFMRNSIEQVIYLIETERKTFSSKNKLSWSGENRIANDRLFKEHIKPVIRELRLVNNGYVWINQINNYDGGDGYALRFVHPNLPDTEGMPLSTNTVDIMGNKPYKTELEEIKKTGELYYDYYFKEMNSEKISHKMSYAKLYKPYNWVIATGVYLNEVDQLINIEKEKMHKTHNRQLLYSFIITLFSISIAVVILIFVEKQISKLINSYEASTLIYTQQLLSEMEKTEKALEEVKKLKGLLPICSQCKKIRDDGGYWNQIEQYIESHSDAQFSHSLCPHCAEMLYGKEPWFKKNKF